MLRRTLLGWLGYQVARPQAAIAGANPPLATYVVSDPANFPSLPLPAKWLIFLNGVYLTPNVDYTFAGASFKITTQLGQGDRISVVDLS